MSLRGGFVQRGLRWGALGLVGLMLATAVTSDADARTRRRAKPKATAAQSYQPDTASIVVDAKSGAVMQASNADSPRHPASLTKIMTLYLLFEQLESGKIKLSSDLPVSAHAAAQAPSKLGLKPGESIQVEAAIRAIVTKSANDVAAIVAEALGGDEPSFARLMTAKARALGMRHTTYFNASGLPDDRQITTARDQSVLGRAIYDRFPQYAHYFATRSFEFRGRAMRNHNKLLGSVPGVDGLKTGYIRASGFNIVTSVRRNNRHIIAVVFGGRTGGARDARARSLIDNNINIASVKRTAPLVVEGWDSKGTAVAALPPPRPEAAEAPAATASTPAVEGPSPGSTAPIKPNAVKTFTVHPGAISAATLTPPPADSQRLTPTPAGTRETVTTVATVKSENPPLPPQGARPGILGTLPATSTKVASAAANVPVPSPAPDIAAKPRPSGWMIQVGAFDAEKDAQQRLSTCKTKATEQLAKAEPFTERISKGEKSLYRARFAGLDKETAEAACKSLKRSDIPCMLLRN
ncbi:MAG: serine hydrolase [Pseudolabrys sp.]